MRTIIAGSREGINQEYVNCILDHHRVFGWFDTIVSGAAPGPDRWAIEYANAFGIPCVVMPAGWETHGKRAGFLRNIEMAKISDELIAFWDGKSRGTKHMIDEAMKRGLIVHVFPPTWRQQ